MRKRFLWMALFLVFTVIALAGCGGSGAAKKTDAPAVAQAPKTAPGTTPAPAPKRLSATMAPGPWGGVLWLPEMIAEGIGSFKEQGVDLKVLQTAGGNDASKALMSGEADFAMIAFDHVLKNRAQGADLVVVAFLNQNPGLIMIVQPELKDSVKSIKDLKGKKIAVSSLGGGTHSTVLSLMKQAGMDVNEIEFVAAKDKLVEMWDKKQIAAAMHVDPQITELVGKGKAWILYDFRKSKDTLALYGTGYPLGTLVTRQEVIDKNPELVQRVVHAVMAANTFIKTHSSTEVAEKVPSEYKADSDPRLYERMVADNIETLSLTGTVTQESMDTVLKELREKKVIPSDSAVSINTAINLTYVRTAPK